MARLDQILELAVRFFPGLQDRAAIPARLLLIAIGFLPITLIGVSTFGVPLLGLAEFVLLPALLIGAYVLVRYRWAPNLVATAMVAGVLATASYDLVRFAFLWTGLMNVDPIPHIGATLHMKPAWTFGYLWRYAGNGAGLSIAFSCLGLRRLREGLLFGLFVCGGLITLLIVAPFGQQDLFPLNVTTVIMLTLGHLTFGAGLVGFRRVLHRASGDGPLAAATSPTTHALDQDLPAGEPVLTTAA